MNRSAGFLITTLLGALFSVAALAQETGAYLGGSLGQSKFTEWCDTSGAPAGFVLTACDDKDTAWKLFGGYRLNRYVAVEATYIDWGEVTASAQFGGPRSASADQYSMGIAAVGNLQLGPRFSVFGKLGFLHTEQKSRVTTTTQTTNTDADEAEIHLGFGVKYLLAKDWALRAEWERTDELKVEMFSLGAELRFAGPAMPFPVDGRGFYLGGSIGQMEVKDFDCPPGRSCDAKDSTWKIFAGYSFNQYFALEGTYADFGSISVSGTAAGIPFIATGDITGWGAAAVGVLPIFERISLFGKAGLMVTEIKLSGGGGGITLTRSGDETDIHFGFGALFEFTKSLGLRLEWERLEKSELNMLSLGAQYKF